jgi:lauroyl/myristoyl acyltransferase
MNITFRVIFIGLFYIFWPLIPLFKPHYIRRVRSHLAKVKVFHHISVRSVYLRMWLNFCTSLYMHLFHKSLHFRYQNQELWDEFWSFPGPRCAFGIHFGPFELAYCALRHPQSRIWVMVKEQKPFWLNQILLKVRQKSGLIFFTPQNLASVLPQLIRENGVLAILIDQSSQYDTEWNWFGQPTQVSLKLVHWMKKQGALILPFAVQNTPTGIKAIAFSSVDETWEKQFETLILNSPSDFTWHYPRFWK